MCSIIVINNGEKEIETPQQFLEHFEFEAPKDRCYQQIDMNSCLCQVDVEEAFREYNISFKKQHGNFYVGQLEKIINDN